jgi:hypothetical protein
MSHEAEYRRTVNLRNFRSTAKNPTSRDSLFFKDFCNLATWRIGIYYAWCHLFHDLVPGTGCGPFPLSLRPGR